jgi:hypothetical protein
MRTGMHRGVVAIIAKITINRKFKVTSEGHRLARTHTAERPRSCHSQRIDLRWDTAAQQRAGEALYRKSARRAEASSRRERGCQQQSSLAWCWKRRGGWSLITQAHMAEVKKGWR